MSLRVPEKWDIETEVVVVGAGTAGLPAAITASEKGAKVTLLEAWSAPASSLAYIAGGTPFAGTDFQKQQGLKDSPDELFEDAVEVSGGSPTLWRVIADRQLDTYEWLTGLGAKVVETWPGVGHREGTSRIHRWEGHGARVLKILRQTAEKRDIEILYKHRAEQLIVDPATDKVIGVRAKTGDKIVNVRAKKAVILTTGGFIRNRELIKEYGPQWTTCVPVTPKTHMGDGLKMAMGVGAATAGIGLAVCPSISVCTETNHTTIMPLQGGIAVNKDARRWADEVGPPYNIMFGDLIRQYPDGLHFIIYDSYIRELASAEDYLKVKEFKADTIEELAKAVGLDPAALKKTVDDYNGSINKYGYDTEFGRKIWCGRRGKEPPPKIEKPPYYGIRCKVSLSSLKGGLKVNEKAQVIDQFGEVIPGLYAAGEIAGGLIAKAERYYTGAMTIGSFVFGRVAGENAAAASSERS